MFRHIRNFVMHLAHFLFHHHRYTNEVVLYLPANLLPDLMFQNILVMVYVYNLRWMHWMVYRLRIMARKLKGKLQNKSFRFVLFSAMDYMCVCVCSFLRVSADLSTFVKHKNISFLLSYYEFNMNIVPYFEIQEKCFFTPLTTSWFPPPRGEKTSRFRKRSKAKSLRFPRRYDVSREC